MIYATFRYRFLVHSTTPSIAMCWNISVIRLTVFIKISTFPLLRSIIFCPYSRVCGDCSIIFCPGKDAFLFPFIVNKWNNKLWNTKMSTQVRRDIRWKINSVSTKAQYWQVRLISICPVVIGWWLYLHGYWMSYYTPSHQLFHITCHKRSRWCWNQYSN